LSIEFFYEHNNRPILKIKVDKIKSGNSQAAWFIYANVPASLNIQPFTAELEKRQAVSYKWRDQQAA